MDFTRKEFLALVGGLGASALLKTGCDSGTTPSGNQDLAGSAACSATNISSNHGHSLTLSMAQASAGAAAGSATMYSILGAADHDQHILLTPAQHQMILAHTAVTVNSDFVLAHMHSVTVNCA